MKINRFWSQFNTFYLIRLIGRNYFYNPALWVSNFILPMIIYSVLSIVLKSESNTIGLAVGIAISGVMAVCMISFAVCFFEWRNSIIYKKIKVSLISEFQFFIAFILFYALIAFFVFWFLIAFVLLFHEIQKSSIVLNQLKQISPTNWMWIVLALFELTIISLLIGLLIAFFVPTAGGAQGLGLMFYILSSFVTGCFLPLVLIGNVSILSNYATVFPVYSAIHTIQTAWLENAIISPEVTADLDYSVAIGKLQSIIANDEIPVAEKEMLTNQIIVDLATSTTNPDVALYWTKVTDNGYQIYSLVNETVDDEYVVFDYRTFSIFGNYLMHNLVSGGWILGLSVLVYLVSRFRYNK